MIPDNTKVDEHKNNSPKNEFITWKNQVVFDFSYKKLSLFSELNINNFPTSNTSDLRKQNSYFINTDSTDLDYVEPSDIILQVSDYFYFDDEIQNRYQNLRESTFISFFISNLIDIPVCFKKSKSLKNKNFEFFFLKFANVFMKDGKKEKSFRYLFSSFFFFFDETTKRKLPQKPELSESNFLDWYKYLFSINKTTSYELKNIVSYEQSEDMNLYENVVKDLNKEIDETKYTKSLLNKLMSQVEPIFLYFIYNVDKNVRKFTRGKSGKYVFVWKYIAPYKRKYLMLKWFLKEIKFDDSKKVCSRLSNMFSLLFVDLKSTHAWKSKNFTYSFIFKNFRKTFMTSLKTVVKK